MQDLRQKIHILDHSGDVDKALCGFERLPGLINEMEYVRDWDNTEVNRICKKCLYKKFPQLKI